MKGSFKTGLGFGLASGTITTLGLLIGLYFSTNSKLVVIAGILAIAISDAFSDAFGIHIAKELENKVKEKSVWEASLSTLVSKFFFASTFLMPVLLFSLQTAILINLIWGFFLITLVSVWVAKIHKMRIWKILLEHYLIAIFVIFVTRFVGLWIANTFS
jgi:VIT1/CCC1 family predicted Fe2+/Mn2+ transporter|tara:strand:- start:1302 stop:1778 length:477 start_codon:yes stop_codon:yes gene_type:complete